MASDFSLQAMILESLAFLLTYLVHSTVLLAGIWLVLAVRRVRSAGLEDTLWKVGLVGGIATAALQTGLGLDAWHGGLRLDGPDRPRVEVLAPGQLVLGPAATEIAGDIRARKAARDVRLQDAQQKAATRPTVSRRADRVARSPRTKPATRSDGATPKPVRTQHASTLSGGPVHWSVLVFAAWAVLAACGVARWVANRCRLGRALAERRPVRDPTMLEVLARLSDRAGLRRPVRLTTSSFLAGPIALGRDEVCVPPRAVRQLAPDQQEALLAHELAHLVRRDPLWLGLCGLLEAVFFFQPLNRMGRRRMQEASEFLCDDWAVARTGGGLSLARCLAEVATWIEGERQPALVAGMARTDSTLVRRVRRLADGKVTSSGRSWRAALLGVSLVPAVACGVPGVTAGDEDPDLLRRAVRALSSAWSASQDTAPEPVAFVVDDARKSFARRPVAPVPDARQPGARWRAPAVPLRADVPGVDDRALRWAAPPVPGVAARPSTDDTPPRWAVPPAPPAADTPMRAEQPLRWPAPAQLGVADAPLSRERPLRWPAPPEPGTAEAPASRERPLHWPVPPAPGTADAPAAVERPLHWPAPPDAAGPSGRGPAPKWFAPGAPPRADVPGPGATAPRSWPADRPVARSRPVAPWPDPRPTPAPHPAPHAAPSPHPMPTPHPVPTPHPAPQGWFGPAVDDDEIEVSAVRIEDGVLYLLDEDGRTVRSVPLSEADGRIVILADDEDEPDGSSDRQREAEREARELEERMRRAEREYARESERVGREYERALSEAQREYDRAMHEATRELERAQEQWQREYHREHERARAEWQDGIYELEEELEEWQSQLDGEDLEEWIYEWEDRYEEFVELQEFQMEEWQEAFEYEYEEQLEEYEALCDFMSDEYEVRYESIFEDYEAELEQLEDIFEHEFEEIEMLYEGWGEEWEDLRDCDHDCAAECAWGCTHPEDFDEPDCEDSPPEEPEEDSSVVREAAVEAVTSQRA